jgi:hypothetical protein
MNSQTQQNQNFQVAESLGSNVSYELHNHQGFFSIEGLLIPQQPVAATHAKRGNLCRPQPRMQVIVTHVMLASLSHELSPSM